VRFRYQITGWSQSDLNGASPASQESTQIPLMRGGSIVSTITGAFGPSLRETRLTALLGYLAALDPEPFLRLFGFRGVANRSALSCGMKRVGRHLDRNQPRSRVIEAKVDATDHSSNRVDILAGGRRS